MKHIIHISENTKHVSISNKMLKLSSNKDSTSIPLTEIESIIFETRHTTITIACLSELSKNNIAVIFPDEKFIPASQLLPYNVNSLHAKHFQTQISINEHLKNDLWGSIISNKILNQYESLLTQNIQVPILLRLSKDPSIQNEALAARYYFQNMFGNSFFRNDETSEINSCLNYGYSIVRSKIIREICGAGLSPVFGVYHNNQYNAFALADDLIEPYRVFVDITVKDFENNSFKNNKNDLLKIGNFELEFDNKKFKLNDSIERYVLSYRESLYNKTNCLIFPRRIK